MIFSLHLALLYFVFFLGEIPVSATDSDIFLDSLPADDSDSLSSSSLLPISFLSDNNNNDIINSNNLFGDGDGDGDAILDGGLTEDDPLLLSYCADSNSQPQEQQQQQPQSKRKTRRQDNNGSICHPPGASELSPPPPPSSPPLSPTITIPEIPDLFNSITNPAAGDSSSGDVYQNQGDVVGKISLEPPQFYCGIFTSQPQRFIVPVCGSGKFVDSVRMARGFYSWVGNSKLGELIWSLRVFFRGGGCVCSNSFAS